MGQLLVKKFQKQWSSASIQEYGQEGGVQGSLRSLKSLSHKSVCEPWNYCGLLCMVLSTWDCLFYGLVQEQILIVKMCLPLCDS